MTFGCNSLTFHDQFLCGTGLLGTRTTKRQDNQVPEQLDNISLVYCTILSIPSSILIHSSIENQKPRRGIPIVSYSVEFRTPLTQRSLKGVNLKASQGEGGNSFYILILYIIQSLFYLIDLSQNCCVLLAWSSQLILGLLRQLESAIIFLVFLFQ